MLSLEKMSISHRRQACAAGFNMVEIVLALGVVAVGVVSIMALFPIGLNANRDAVARSYSADSVDQFLHYYAQLLKRSDTNWTNYQTGLPLAKPSVADDRTLSWTQQGSTNFYYSSGNAGFWKIEQMASGSDLVDFSAICRVWKNPLSADYYDSGSSTWQSDTIDYAYALGINLEISWPVQLPYAQRQKELYYFELFNPNN